MRIGIITLPLWTNFGGILQNYALTHTLRELGHDVVTLDPTINFHEWNPRLLYKIPKRFITKYILNDRRDLVFRELARKRTHSPLARYTEDFVSRHIHLRHIKNYKKLNRLDFDALIVGSDQIWRPKYNRSIEDCYLRFAQKWDVRRVAYAVSFGTAEWEYTPQQTKACAALAQRFDAISVREDTGVKLCREYLGVNAIHLPDPTLLLEAEHYKGLINESPYPIPHRQGVAAYLLDETNEKIDVLQKVAEALGSKYFFPYNRSLLDTTKPVKERVQRPVEEFLAAFRDADFVVTDSFHGCVFSIIFERPFIVINNHQRGASRMGSLLTSFDLKDRLIDLGATTDLISNIRQIMQHPLDIEKIRTQRTLLKCSALDFLSSQINHN